MVNYDYNKGYCWFCFEKDLVIDFFLLLLSSYCNVREVNFILWMFNVEYVVNNERGYVYSDFSVISRIYEFFLFYLFIFLIGYELNIL